MPPFIPIIEAGVTDSTSMAALCKRTRLIVNSVGPFRLYGESVVAAYVEVGVDYLDITGEQKFMEMMEEHYHSSALLTGSLIISACAYDYVTANLGVIFHSRQWKPLFVPHSVDAYVVLESEKRVVLNVTSFESAVVAIAHAQEDQKLRTYETLRPEGQGRRRIGIAGRNQEKLAEALRWAAQRALQMPPLIPIIEAGVTDSALVAALCKRTWVIMNCVGPFRLYGESVVTACVEASVDYLDIAGEEKFMEMMEEHYHRSTLLTGSLIISACAYDYVTADLGVIFHSRQWKPLSVPQSMDSYVVLESEKRVVLNVTGFESAVVATTHAQEDQKLRTYMTLRKKHKFFFTNPEKPSFLKRESYAEMGDGALDTVILGTSGFAAKYILREFMRYSEQPEGQGRIRIGIAGRNREKLAEALRWATQGAL
ncbi:hypothetical protein SUGI_0258770 [Cryptomeria japonica]|nr:hypothetical protein SUGI_0258770 [Cryptomeria japonica]